ncbi:MAG: PAS domain-containing protein [Mangrovicoccus sp.]|nr:PAS domain-containing protein [Mangrovicoccus sp.]
MTDVMMTADSPSTAQDAARILEGNALEHGDLLFSKSDLAGQITAVNEAFASTAGYGVKDLIGEPHKKLRHPEMPRGLFWLLWERLKAGEPTGAYLKNQAEDGTSYWVFALICPIENGYASIQMKPSSEFLDQIKAEYAVLRRAEMKENLPPQTAGAAFLDQLAGIGYPSFTCFIAKAFSAEIASRNSALGQGSDPMLAQFEALTEKLREVEELTRALSDTFAAIRSVPINMRILASQLEASGGPISVISANYSTMSDEISEWTERFITDSSGTFGRVQDALATAQFLQALAGTQADMAQRILEGKNADAGAELAAQSLQFREQALSGLSRVTHETEGFARAIVDMKRLVTGLSSTRMMCKIEGARLHKGRDSISGIINQLDGFQDQVEDQITRIIDINRALQTGSENLRASGA